MTNGPSLNETLRSDKSNNFNPLLFYFKKVTINDLSFVLSRVLK